MALNLNTDLALINTTANAGTITLPLSTTIPGRVITFKDITATFGQNTLTLNTTSPDTFEDGATTKVLSESGGIIQLVGSSNKWFILAGTQQNTLNISSLLAISISTNTISSMNASVSTINFQNNVNSTLSLYQTSTLLYFNSNVLAGSKVLPGTLLTRYITGGFKPTQVSGIAVWLDAADPLGTGTPPSNGSALSTWFDKSGNGRNFTTTSGSPTYTSPLQGVFINGATLDIMRSPSLTYTSGVTSLFVVVKITSTNAGYDYILVFGDNTSDNSLRYNGGGTFNPNDIFNGTAWYLNGTSGLTLIPTSVFNATTLFDGVINYTNTTVLQLSTSFNGRYLTGFVQEVILYNSVVTNNNRELIEGYLSWKWGLQANLSVNNPYRSFAPTNIY